MYWLIEDNDKLEVLINSGYKKAFIDIIPSDHIEHPVYNSISLLYIRPLEADKGYMLGINHDEVISVNKTRIDTLLSKFDTLYCVDKKERYIVGVNSFVKEKEEIDIPILEIRSEVQKEQIERLNKVKNERNNEKVDELLLKITKTAKEGGNVMHPIIEASLEYATLGEIVDAMKVVYGEWTENISI